MKPSCRPSAARRVDHCQPPADSRSARLVHGVTWALVVLVSGGCAANLDKLSAASKREPTNAQVQLDYLHERNHQVDALLDDADRLRAAYQFDEAIQKLEAVYKLDPNSERGRKIGAAIELDRRDAVILLEAERMIKRGSYDTAAERVGRVLAENPNNVPALHLYREIEEKRHLQRLARDEKNASASIMRKPVTLQFRDANVRMVFEALRSE